VSLGPVSVLVYQHCRSPVICLRQRWNSSTRLPRKSSRTAAAVFAEILELHFDNGRMPFVTLRAAEPNR